MWRLTTDTPDDNVMTALNLFYAKDGETWVRGGGAAPDYPDITLYEFIRGVCGVLTPDLELPSDNDNLSCLMADLLFDGSDEPTGIVALLYMAAWVCAELRGRLMQYEDTGVEPAMCANYKTFEDEAISKGVTFKRIVALMEANKDGRLVVLPCKVGDTLWVTGRDNVPREMELKAPDIRAVCTDEDNLCMSTCNRKPDGFCAYRLRNDGADIGKTVFLTREEAERALEAMKDE